MGHCLNSILTGPTSLKPETMPLKVSNSTDHGRGPQSRLWLVLPSAPLFRHATSLQAWRRRAIVQPPLKRAKGLQLNSSALDPSDQTWPDVDEFLAAELDLTPLRIQKLMSRDPSLAVASIDAELMPNIATIRSLGAGLRAFSELLNVRQSFSGHRCCRGSIF